MHIHTILKYCTLDIKAHPGHACLLIVIALPWQAGGEGLAYPMWAGEAMNNRKPISWLILKFVDSISDISPNHVLQSMS